MNPFKLLMTRVRGFLVLELAQAVILTILVLTVYMAKTGAGDKRDDIDRVQQQIEDETVQIRLLRAEVATEERPERLEALAGQYLGLQPAAAKHEIDPEALADIAQQGKTVASAAASATKIKAPVAAAPAAAVATPASLPVPAATSPLQKASYVERSGGVRLTRASVGPPPDGAR